MWQFLTKINILTIWSSTFLGIYPIMLKTCIQTKTCTHMYIALSFVGERIHKLLVHSALKGNEKTWRKLKYALLSGKWKRPIGKTMYCMILITWHSGKGKNHGDIKRKLAPWSREGDVMEHREFQGVLYDNIMRDTSHYVFVQNHRQHQEWIVM